MARVGKKQIVEVPNLTRAVEHGALAQHSIGQPYQSHMQIGFDWAVSFDGVIAAGWRVGEQFTGCPHTLTLRDALVRAGNEYSITEAPNGDLIVRGLKGRFVVPCVPQDVMPRVSPDENIAPIGVSVLEALIVCGEFVKDNAVRVVEACVLLQSGSCVGTDGKALVEYWHGFDLPPGLCIPKSFITTLSKMSREPTGFGFTDRSVTFWFGSDAWVRTQLFDQPYPAYSRLFDGFDEAAFRDIPNDIGEASKALAKFRADSFLHFSQTGMRTHPVDAGEIGGSWDVTHEMPIGSKIYAPGLDFMLTHTTQWSRAETSFMFRGVRTRGLVIG